MKLNIKKIAILCSGGNAPGMSSCINTFIKKCLSLNITPITFSNGFVGLYENRYRILKPKYTQSFISDGSALIGTSRSPEFAKSLAYRQKCANNLKALNIDALFVIGGEGSYKGAYELSKLGIKVITIPATIDNDISSTDYTIGYDTCLNNICRVIDNINDVFISHHGVAIIEIMGRSCPDLTIRSGIANGATYIVTKDSLLTKDQFVNIVKKAFAKGKINATFIDRLLANYMINIGMISLLAGRYNRAICLKNHKTHDIDLMKAIRTKKRKNLNRILVSQFNKINQE